MNIKSTLTNEVRNKLGQVPYLLDLLNFNGVYLAGGLLRTLYSKTEEFSPEKTDVDLFFQSELQLQVVQSYLENETAYKKVFQCPEGKLASFVYKNSEEPAWKLQLITVSFYPDIDAVLNSFDFTVTMFGTDGVDTVSNEFASQDVEDMRLRWNKVTYPASSLRRMMKYAKKGYSMREEDYQTFVARVWEHDVNIIDGTLVYVD